MILGIGIDIVSVERIQLAMRRPGFLTRVLTEPERSRSLSAASVAGRWAAKEAVAKCLGCKLGWHDVVIEPSVDGRPEVTITRSGVVSDNEMVHVSITHDHGMAAAVAIWERTNP